MLDLNVSEVGIQKLYYGHQQSLIFHTCWVNLEKPTKNKGTMMEENLDENEFALYYTVYVGADLKTYSEDTVMFIIYLINNIY